MAKARKPKHLKDLEDCGKTFADLSEFRKFLSPFRITVCWNTKLRVWILCKVNQPGLPGPTYVTLKLGHGAMAEAMEDPAQVARDFERMLSQTSPPIENP